MADIQKREITKELRESYLDYAMSVIVSRALPDVRDGLKPVQRRILWAMWEMGLDHSSKFRKCANVVGEVMAKYHPHGDSAIYDTLVRLAQDFSLRYPLVDGQGNFGSIDGDSAAAYRYTESRLKKISDEMLLDIEKETVDWVPNYDASKKEPAVLPGKLPNLLLNGTLGIAVGMATSIPPHNLGELADAILHLSEDPEATTEDLLKYVKGPDFPTGGVIFDEKAIKQAYISGRGAILTQAKAIIEERKKDHFDIIVTEIPYMVNKAELIKQIAELVQDKRIEGIRDLRDESDRESMVRIVIELKSDASPQKVLNQLYKHTNLQKDFHMNMVALVNGIEPRTLSLRDVLVEYLTYRKIVIRRRTEFDLKKAQERAHILEGLSTALDTIDKIISTIRKSKDKDEARANLMKGFKLSEIQANAILEMRLQTLAALERKKIEDELKEKLALIKELQGILKSTTKILEIIQKEVKELKEKYGDARRTQVISTGLTELKDEDLIPQEEAIITFSSGGYIKRLPPDTFSSQKRGGKGLIGSDVQDEDFLIQFVTANTHDQILFFTDKGRVFQTKVYEIPAASRTSKGRAIHNFLEMPADEKVKAMVTYSQKIEDKFLVMATSDGNIKKTPLEDFTNIRRTGIIAISLNKGDELRWVGLTSGSDELLITTAKAQSIRFKETQIRPMGRTAAGVRAIKLKKEDHVAGFDIIRKGTDAKQVQVLVVMENGFGKQTPLSEYKIQNRGGSGIRTANITAKTGQLIASRVVYEEHDLFALSAKGQVIRTELTGVRKTGRSAQGVRVMNLNAGDKLAAIAIL
jgi:DNA gyrase subunit A